MSEQQQAYDVLLRLQTELIREIARAGTAGGTGRVNSYAPQLVSVTQAMQVLEYLKEPVPKEEQSSVADRMAAVRAAKTK